MHGSQAENLSIHIIEIRISRNLTQRQGQVQSDSGGVREDPMVLIYNYISGANPIPLLDFVRDKVNGCRSRQPADSSRPWPTLPAELGSQQNFPATNSE